MTGFSTFSLIYAISKKYRKSRHPVRFRQPDATLQSTSCSMSVNSRRFYAELRKRFPQFRETASKSGAVFHGVGMMVEGNCMTPEDVL